MEQRNEYKQARHKADMYVDFTLVKIKKSNLCPCAFKIGTCCYSPRKLLQNLFCS